MLCVTRVPGGPCLRTHGDLLKNQHTNLVGTEQLTAQTTAATADVQPMLVSPHDALIGCLVKASQDEINEAAELSVLTRNNPFVVTETPRHQEHGEGQRFVILSLSSFTSVILCSGSVREVLLEFWSSGNSS